MDQVVAQAQGAVDDLGADPAAAEKKLSALRETVTAAENGLDGEQKARLEEARVALDELAKAPRRKPPGPRPTTRPWAGRATTWTPP